MEERARRFRFTRAMRLTHRREFQRVFDARTSRAVGPLVVYARPNDLARPRLGLTVGRRVGPAVLRNRVKRLLREAFRLRQHELPAGYDFVVVARAHEPLPARDYERLLFDAAAALEQRWTRRIERERPTIDRTNPPATPGSGPPPAS